MGNRNASGAVKGYYSSAVTEEKCTHDALPIAVGHRRLRNFLAQHKGEYPILQKSNQFCELV